MVQNKGNLHFCIYLTKNWIEIIAYLSNFKFDDAVFLILVYKF